MKNSTFAIHYSEALSRACRRQFCSPAVRAADRRAVRHFESLQEYAAHIAECDSRRAELHGIRP